MASASVLSHSSSSHFNHDHSYAPSTTALHERRSRTHEIHNPKNAVRRPQALRMASAPSGFVGNRGKLHKHQRSDSGSSLLSVTSTINEHSAPKIRATERIKPYLRKMSLQNDDAEQGRLDLSRPSAEHDDMGVETATGLGIRDFGAIPRSVSDVSFMPATRRRSTHRRATSLSQLSTQSTPLRPTQAAAIQSIRHTSHPYTPPSAFSTTTFPHSEDEVDESADILSDDLRRTSIERWRSRRTTSTGSAPYCPSLQLSHTHSAASLTGLANPSLSNLSTRSGDSNRSGPELKMIQSRRNTSKSFDLGTSASSRTSIDKAVSVLLRTSEPEDPSARAANIRALRRAFEEKEAAKERKMEQMEMKRRNTAEMRRVKKDERQRRQSEVSDEKPTRRRQSTNTAPIVDREFLGEKVAGREYSRHSPVHRLSLPLQGTQGGAATEARATTEVSKTKAAKSVWVRFRAWSKTRMLSCY